MNIGDLIIYNKTIPKREAKNVDFPSTLSPELCEYLSQNGITKLYCHQAEMFEKAMEGNNYIYSQWENS